MTIFSFLFLRYPSTFIETEFRKFFGEQLHPTSIVSFIQTEEQFLPIHDKLLSSPPSDQLPITKDTLMIGSMVQPSSAFATNTTTPSETTENEKMTKHTKHLFIHYSYEKRLRTMKRGLHQVHGNLFNQSANGNVKMIVGTRNRRSATHELIRKRPPPFLLKDRERPSNRYVSAFFSDTFRISSTRVEKRRKSRATDNTTSAGNPPTYDPSTTQQLRTR